MSDYKRDLQLMQEAGLIPDADAAYTTDMRVEDLFTKDASAPFGTLKLTDDDLAKSVAAGWMPDAVDAIGADSLLTKLEQTLGAPKTDNDGAVHFGQAVAQGIGKFAGLGRTAINAAGDVIGDAVSDKVQKGWSRTNNLLEMAIAIPMEIGNRSQTPLFQYLINLSKEDTNWISAFDRKVLSRAVPELLRPDAAIEDASMWAPGAAAINAVVDASIAFVDDIYDNEGVLNAINSAITAGVATGVTESRNLTQKDFGKAPIPSDGIAESIHNLFADGKFLEKLDVEPQILEHTEFIAAAEVIQAWMGTENYTKARQEVLKTPFVGPVFDILWDGGELGIDIFASADLLFEFAPAVFTKAAKSVNRGAELASGLRSARTLADTDLMVREADEWVARARATLDKADTPENAVDLVRARKTLEEAKTTHARVKNTSGGPSVEVYVGKPPTTTSASILQDSKRDYIQQINNEVHASLAAGGGRLEESIQLLDELAGATFINRDAMNEVAKAAGETYGERVAKLVENTSRLRFRSRALDSQRKIWREQLKKKGLSKETRDHLKFNIDRYDQELAVIRKDIQTLSKRRQRLGKNPNSYEALKSAYEYMGNKAQAQYFENQLDSLKDVAEMALTQANKGEMPARELLAWGFIMEDLGDGSGIPPILKSQAKEGDGARGLATVEDKVAQAADVVRRLVKRHNGVTDKAALAKLDQRIAAARKEAVDLATGQLSVAAPSGRVVKNPAAKLIEKSEKATDYYVTQIDMAIDDVKGNIKVAATGGNADAISALEIQQTLLEDARTEILGRLGGSGEDKVRALAARQDMLHEEIVAERLHAAMSEPAFWADMVDILGKDEDLWDDLVMRGVMGAPDYEFVGDALARVVAGADPKDIAVQQLLVPEYDPSPLYRVRPNVYVTPIAPGEHLSGKKAKKFADQAAMELNNAKLTADGWLPEVHLTDLEASELKKAREFYSRDAVQLERLNKQFADAVHLREDFPMYAAEKVDRQIEKLARNKARKLSLIKSRPDLYEKGLTDDSLMMRYTGYLRSMLYKFGEPTRVLHRYPNAVARLQTGLARAESVHDAYTEMFQKHLQQAGILTVSSSGAVKVNDELAEHMFTVLNTKPKKSDDILDMLNDIPGDIDQAEYIRATQGIRETMDDMARALGIYSDESSYIMGYMPRILNDVDVRNGHRMLDMVGLRPSAKVFLSHLLNRTARDPGDIKTNIVDVLEIYTRRTSRKLVVEPMLRDILSMSKAMDRPAAEFVGNLVNAIKGRPTNMDKLMGNNPLWTGAKRTAAAAVGLTYHGLLTGRMKYVLMAYATSAATTAGRVGGLSTLKGIGAMMTPKGRALAKASGLDRTLVNLLGKEGRLNSLFRTLETIPVFGLNSVEFAIRGMSFHASLSAQIRQLGFKSVDDLLASNEAERVLFDALRDSEQINHVFGVSGQSLALNQLLGGSAMRHGFTQFLSFTPKQMAELADQYRRNPGMFMRYLAYSGFLTRALGHMNVDIKEHVGLEFPKTQLQGLGIRGNLAGPNINMVKNIIQLGAISMSESGDPNKAAELAELIAKDAINLIPLAKAASELLDTTRKAGQFAAGETPTELDTKGRLIRELNTGQDETSILGKLGVARTSDSELFATGLGVNSVSGRLEKEAVNRARNRVQVEMFKRQKIMDEITLMITNGSNNTDRLERLVKEAAEAGIPLPDINERAKFAETALHLNRLLRHAIENLKSPGVLENYIKYQETQQKANALREMGRKANGQ